MESFWHSSNGHEIIIQAHLLRKMEIQCFMITRHNEILLSLFNDWNDHLYDSHNLERLEMKFQEHFIESKG